MKRVERFFKFFNWKHPIDKYVVKISFWLGIVAVVGGVIGYML
jgi:hypothetical protein